MTTISRIAVALITVALVATAATAAGVDPAEATQADESTCEVVSQSWTAAAEPDPTLTDRFADYGNRAHTWTGGDSTYSVDLGHGRRVWLFSDTFVGPVHPDGSQPTDTQFVNSSFVVQQGDHLTRTVTGGTPNERIGLLPPTENGWYWLGAGHLAGRQSLDVIFVEFERFGPGQWDWAWKSNVLGRFSPTSLRLRDVVPLPSASGVSWASWILGQDGYTYVYGVEDLGGDKYMHLARVQGEDLTRPWQFWDGDGWVAEELQSARIMVGVANEYSVSPFGDGYLLVTQDTTEVFSRDIVAYTACAPTGPFTRVATLYQTPETGLFGSYGNPNIFTYNAHEHPDLRGDDGSLLVTYNVNSFNPDDLYADAGIYRPRFVRVQLTPGS